MDFWIINLVDKQLEVYNQLYQTTNGDYNYRPQHIYLDDDVIKLLFCPDSFLVFLSLHLVTHIPHIFCPIKDYGLEPCEHSVGKQMNL